MTIAPTHVYPVTPVNVPESVTKPSAAFKKEVTKVVGSILFFFVVYLLLMALATGLAVAAVYGGILLIVAIPKIITIIVGVGIVGLGIMVLLFLVKFIFAVSRFDHSTSIEIKEKDHPKLFHFIRRVTKDTQTPFPKRIYLSPEVNASVFYDSGFWSMILPVKKNLQIGLGLVNSVNLSEFKAVMAHEFGHFSQRSMRLGSFVYNVNRVIYNMLYENNSYGGWLEKWASVSGYFAFFAGLTVRIVSGIQYVLRDMYSLINKNYMRLSREMEFHADAVAASVSGSDNCISALRRLELAGAGYNAVMEKCDELWKEKCITGNIYDNQHSVFRQYASVFKLTLQDELPVVTAEFLNRFNTNRVNYKDQWASHPSLEERTEHLRSLAVTAETRWGSAWILFDNPEEWQHKLTAKVYKDVKLTDEVNTIDQAAFEKQLTQHNELYTLPEVYCGFYNNRSITKLNISHLSLETIDDLPDTVPFEQIFNQTNAGLHQKISALENDIQVLNAIAEKQISTKTFDFDGVKYNATDAAGISTLLQKELKTLQQELERLDKEAYLHFYRKALQTGMAMSTNLKDGYCYYLAGRDNAELFLNNANTILKELSPLYEGRSMTIQDINGMMQRVKENEKTLKAQLRFWLMDGAFEHALVFKKQVQEYLGSDFQYFSGESFDDTELSALNYMINEGWHNINDFLFRKFKSLLEFQLTIS